jgi:hypothetical protein
LVRLTPAGDRLPSQLLTAQRATLAELLAELPEADQRHLAAALESLRAVLARHPDASPLATSMGRNGSLVESSSRRLPRRDRSPSLR